MIEIDGEEYPDLSDDAKTEKVIHALKILTECFYQNKKREIKHPGLSTAITNLAKIMEACVKVNGLPLYAARYGGDSLTVKSSSVKPTITYNGKELFCD